MNAKQRAGSLINRDIRCGKITRPDKCEICQCKTDQRVWETNATDKFVIVAHHWRGYDYPFDVWWVCISCNALLRGIHNGSLEKHEFIQIMTNYMPISRASFLLGINRRILLNQVKKGKYPGSSQLSNLIGSSDSPYADPWFIPKSSLMEATQ